MGQDWSRDLALAFRLADLADAETLGRWSPDGVAATEKGDGTPVTAADIGAEQAMLAAVQQTCPEDRFLGEEVGAHGGTSDRRWIVDGIDGTRFFVAGLRTWGTLIALESGGEIVLGLATSPAQNRRWWATRGGGAFTGPANDRSTEHPIGVSGPRPLRPDRVVTLPHVEDWQPHHRAGLRDLIGGDPDHQPWSHQIRVATGEADLCVWFAGDIWDHAAPSILVEEAGGRFSDHSGGRRLDTRTAVYSNGTNHDETLAALSRRSQ